MTKLASLSKFLWRAAVFLVVLALVVFYLIVGTESGLQLVWSEVQKFTPEKIHVGSLRGNLISHLSVRDLTYQDDSVAVTIQSLDFSWDAWDLISKHLVVRDIAINGVDVQMRQAASTSSTQSSSLDTSELLAWLSMINIHRAAIHDAHFNLAGARIELEGALDTDWHMQWSANVPDLSQLVHDVHGKLVTTGTVAGSRLQPEINADISLNKFVTNYFNILSLTGNIHSKFKNHLTDNGTLKVKGLSIKGYRVPDLTLKTASQLKDGIYQLQAAAELSPVNIVTAQLTLPQFTSVMNINQTFYATAKVNVQDFSQFNTLFVDVPQIRSLTGQVTGAFRADGELMHPVIDGGLHAQHGSVFVPSAKMRLSDINLQANYHTGQKVTLKGTFVAGHGAASIDGTFGIEESSLPLLLTVRGSNVLAMDSKEYKVKISPDMKLSYIDNDLFLSGQILVPEADVQPVDFRATATLPSDVVIVNHQSVVASVPTNVALQVKVILGDHVKFKYRDLKTKLQGTINISGMEGKPLSATGEFRIDNGTYRAYGRTLMIQGGRIIYAGNFLTNPGISLRAIQMIKTVGFSGNSQFDQSEFKPVYSGADSLTVGIAVSGVIDKPRITLFSEPSGLSQGNILSYLLFGYPQSQASGASGLALLNVASEMYGGPEKANVVGNLQNTLGLDELSVGTMEYFNASDNLATNNNASTVKNATTVNMGRNLGHDLSLHYSVGLFQQIQVFSLRYQINKHLAIQTETSTLENGGDLFYQLESRH